MCKCVECVEECDSECNLLLFCLESLFSWLEYLVLDCCSDDEDDLDGVCVVEDFDCLLLLC